MWFPKPTPSEQKVLYRFPKYNVIDALPPRLPPHSSHMSVQLTTKCTIGVFIVFIHLLQVWLCRSWGTWWRSGVGSLVWLSSCSWPSDVQRDPNSHSLHFRRVLSLWAWFQHPLLHHAAGKQFTTTSLSLSKYAIIAYITRAGWRAKVIFHIVSSVRSWLRVCP